MRKVLLAAAVLAMMLATAPVSAYVYFSSTFDGDVLANPTAVPPTYPVPRNWVAGSGLTAAMCPDRFSVINSMDEIGYPEQLRVLRIHDPIGLAPDGITNVTGYPAALSRTFAATSSGTVTLTFEVMFYQNSSALRVYLCSDATVTGVASWATALIFEGAEPWGNPEVPGNISYLSFWDLSAGSPNTTYNKIPDLTYDGWQWYSVRIEANVDTKKWRAFLGNKGTSPLPMILDWTDFVYSGSTQPGTQGATKLAQVLFWTSNKTGNELDGLFYIDNVKVEGPVAPQSFNTIAEARLADKGAVIQVTDKVVTAGTDQLGAFFYIQDDGRPGAGIRVRYFNGVVHAGDRVDVTGMLAQASDNGGAVLHNGEREIQSELVTIHPAHDPVPTPVALRNSQVSGGWLGPNEQVTGGPEPRLKGAWPSNKWGDATSYALGTNTMAPLYNTGGLITTCGKVTRLCANDTAPYSVKYPDIYIDDGSLKFDGCRAGSATADPANPAPGIRVKISGAVAAQLPAIALGDYVSVTGIAGVVGNSDVTTFYGTSGIRNIRVVRLLKASDLVKIAPPAP